MGYTYLTPNLAQGSAPPIGVELPFDTIVLSAKEYQPYMPGRFEVLRVELSDRFPPEPPPTHAECAAIRRLAREVASRVREGQRVLVTCHKGKNRSGVIAGLALVELGVPRLEAARRIQRLRDGLRNPYFYEMVIGS